MATSFKVYLINLMSYSHSKLYIESLQRSVKVHRRRRECMVKQSRSDIDNLLLNDRLPEALPKTKHFYEDEKRLSAYDQVEYFCTSILRNFSLLNRQSDVHLLPKETKEAMAGLIFVASRIGGELKELQIIRSLFVKRFGLEFDKDCVDLRPGHLFQIICSDNRTYILSDVAVNQNGESTSSARVWCSSFFHP
ncbi:unnamed protein product [Eruca vesicaria subsp. sativa]|uniref:Uncharacterized protein n=1 Tax=Eruca vesicaria subsp. sativa TaxID=29727 RepID=A0ABC8JTE7_ERUVS|nr:unnamed protein product [Eruca vesicaria subsp. sativa]